MLTFYSFLVLGALAVVLAVFLITRRNPVSAAMLLIAKFVVLAAMYGLLDAHFAAATQIIVYAGAIMVIFVFVIMLLNIPIENISFGIITLWEWVLIFAGLFAVFTIGNQIFMGWINTVLQNYFVLSLPKLPYPESQNVQNVAVSLFTDYLWAFELSGFVLLAATVGAVVVSRKRSDV